MRLLASLLFVVTVLAACSSADGQGSLVLAPADFQAKLAATPDAQLVDVRTSGEYNAKHLAGAMLADQSASDFDSKTASLDKNKPVFVYCFVGGRSANAARRLKAAGFKEVYDLQGGVMSWEKNGLPLESGNAKLAGAGVPVSAAEFDGWLAGDQPVLVDFWAPWCVPCRKMGPTVEQLTKEYEGKVRIVKVDADANPELIKRFAINGMPTLIRFEKGQPVNRHEGYLDEAGLRKMLD